MTLINDDLSNDSSMMTIKSPESEMDGFFFLSDLYYINFGSVIARSVDQLCYYIRWMDGWMDGTLIIDY
jgi:hypothetical protein